LVANMVEGVTVGFTKTLEIQGVGYRAQLKGRDLELALGYSHPVPIKAPDGIEFEVPQPTRVIIKGNSKQVVGEIAAIIRKQRRLTVPRPRRGPGRGRPRGRPDLLRPRNPTAPPRSSEPEPLPSRT